MINCVDIANKILEKTKLSLTNYQDVYKQPTIAIIMVGDNKASQIYIKNKIHRCQQLNIKHKLLQFDSNIDTDHILATIDKLNHDQHIHAVLVQMPLPKHLDQPRIINSIANNKDVDGFSAYNLGLLMQGNFTKAIIPCTPKGIIYIIDTVLKKNNSNYENNKYAGLVCVILGRSNIVGKPLANILINLGATVIVANSHSKNINNLLALADILVVAIGSANSIDLVTIKPNALVIDVGINYINNKIYGDIIYNQQIIEAKNIKITPVPKGVGPMTVAMLMSNICNCYLKEMH